MEEGVKKILIVDDEPEIMELTKRKLERAGYRIRHALNGLQALKVIRDEPVDLILLDVVMPEMNGFSFYKELMNDQDLCRTPVIVLTGRSGMEDTFLALGADNFLPKPFSGEVLLKKIEDALNKTADKGENHLNVLLAGSSRVFVENMSKLLETKRYEADFALTGQEILNKTVEFDPNTILIDVSLSDMPAHELIIMLRNLPRFKNKSILTYTYQSYREEKYGFPKIKYLAIQNEKEACRMAGASEYLGFINEASFLQVIIKYLR